MRKIIISVIIVSFGMGPVLAKAGDVTVSIALDEQASILSQLYKCSDGKEYLVRYVNSGSNNLARLRSMMRN
jgi:membrane-bound inhibitor of C-type lysozyme